MVSPRGFPCPRCGLHVEWSTGNKSRPFCSERCKLIDLGQWATEAYRVPQAEPPDPGDEKPENS